MGKTPRTDEVVQNSLVISGYQQLRDYLADHARRLEKEIEEFKRIRELCIKSLVIATGASREAVEEGPMACAVKAKEKNAMLAEACSIFSEWLEREDAGPQYPEGTDRDSEGGESIWREWYDGSIALRHQAMTLARAALAQSSKDDGSKDQREKGEN